jgi:ribosome biogenesis SPOUT family RNA methylase Rps3
VKKPLIVIEHLEPKLSRWLALEYEHSAAIAEGRLVITNCSEDVSRLARRLNVPCYDRSIVELRGTLYREGSEVIILDPQAPVRLEVGEAVNAKIIVVGGILGDHPPRGRTKKLLSDRMPDAIKRNIGPYQFSIDGAVYIAKLVSEGVRLEQIEFVVGLRLKVPTPYGLEVEVELPYAYPLVAGRPLIHPKLPELIARGLAYEEYRELGLAEEDKSNTPPRKEG